MSAESTALVGELSVRIDRALEAAEERGYVRGYAAGLAANVRVVSVRAIDEHRAEPTGRDAA